MICEYEIAGIKFIQKNSVYGQYIFIREWLGGIKLQSMSPDEYQRHLLSNPLRFLSIVLLRENETQADKVSAGEEGLIQSEAWFRGHVGAELFELAMRASEDFFGCNPPEMAFLIDGEITIKEKKKSKKPDGTGLMTP